MEESKRRMEALAKEAGKALYGAGSKDVEKKVKLDYR